MSSNMLTVTVRASQRGAQDYNYQQKVMDDAEIRIRGIEALNQVSND